MNHDGRWLRSDEEALWRAWLGVHARQHVVIARDLKASGLSEPDFEVLVHLTDAPDGQRRVSELAAGLQWERSRVSHQVTRMAKRGLVERHDVAEDARGARVVITREGRAAIEKAAPPHVARVREVFIDRLDAADRVDLARILRKLVP